MPTYIARSLWLVIALLLVSACTPDVPAPTPTLPPVDTPTPAIPPTATPTPTITPTPTLTPTPTPTPLPTPMALVVSVSAEDNIDLHSDPDARSEVVGKLGPGEFVPLVDMTDDGLWLKVGLQTIGWVSARLVSLSGDVLVNDATAPRRQGLLQADTPVNVRSGPGVSYRVLGQLKSGQMVPVVDVNETGSWLQIDFKGRDGWVNADTVIVAGGDPTPTPEVTEEVTREP
jgi:uncharacterized protein YgiM (DUF1202 family)